MKTKIFLLLWLFCITACGINEGIVQRAERGYIEFTGNINGAMVQIDNSEPFVITHSVYQIGNGKHRIRVHRDKRLLVDRLLFIDDQTRLEVQIP